MKRCRDTKGKLYECGGFNVVAIRMSFQYIVLPGKGGESIPLGMIRADA